MLAADVEQVGGAHDAVVLAGLVDDGVDAVLRLGHDLAGVVDRGVDREALDLGGGEHLGADGDRHRQQAGGRVGVVRGDDDGAAALLGEGDDALGDLGVAADDEDLGAAVDGELLGLVAVGAQDDVALLDSALHHLGGGADAHLAAHDDVVGVAQDDLAVERGGDVGVAGLRLGQGLGVEDVHVGVGDVANGDDAGELVAVEDAQGAGLLVAHAVPGREEAGLRVDAGLLGDLDVLDLRGDGGDERGLLEAEVLEDEGRLAVEGAGAAGLVDRLVDLVLEVGVRDGRADAVGVGVQVADDVDLADCLRHSSSLSVSVACAADVVFFGCMNCATPTGAMPKRSQAVHDCAPVGGAYGTGTRPCGRC